MDTATTQLQLENILKMQACVPDVLASIMGISTITKWCTCDGYKQQEGAGE